MSILQSLGFGAPQPDPMQAQQMQQPMPQQQGLGSRINQSIADHSGTMIALGGQLLAHRHNAANAPFDAQALMVGQQMDSKRKKEREEAEKERRSLEYTAQFLVDEGIVPNIEMGKQMAQANPQLVMPILQKRMQGPEKPDYPNSYEEFLLTQQNPAYGEHLANRKGGVNVDARQMGNIPPGYRAEYDEQDRVIGLVPIPGGPAEAEMRAAEGERATAQESQASIAGFTLRDARVAKEDIPKMSDTAAVRLGKSKIPMESPEYRVAQFYDSLRGTIAIEQLLNIKRQGSGLGQVPQSQLDMLSFLMGKLDMGLPKEDQKMIVEDIQQRYKEILARMTPEDRAMVGIAEREYNALTGQGGGGNDPLGIR